MLKVKVNAEQRGASERVAERFDVRGYPAVFVMKKGGRPQPIMGYAPPGPYMAQIDALLR